MEQLGVQSQRSIECGYPSERNSHGTAKRAMNIRIEGYGSCRFGEKDEKKKKNSEVRVI